MCEEVGEKAGDVEIKANLQLCFGIWEIDFRCPRDHRLSVKKNKENANQELWDRDHKNKDKTKSHNFFSIKNQPQASKKNKRRSPQRDLLVIRVNGTKIDKNKAKDLSHIMCYICKEKGHYTNKCSKMSKN